MLCDLRRTSHEKCRLRTEIYLLQCQICRKKIWHCTFIGATFIAHFFDCDCNILSQLIISGCYSSSWAASFFFGLFIIFASTEDRSSSKSKSVSISVFLYPLFMLWSFWYRITVGYWRILKLWQIDFPLLVSQSTLLNFTKTTLKTHKIAQTLKNI